MRYIYFEVREYTGCMAVKPEVINENVLLLKPNTNSDGSWGFRHVTERTGLTPVSYCIVDQYWVDLDKYDPFKYSYQVMHNKWIEIALEKLKFVYRDEKIEEVLN